MSLPFHHLTILGATGATGRALADLWLERGATVRVVSRSAANLERDFGGLAVERLAADALDPDSLRAAVEGTGLVYDCIGLPAARLGDHPVTARNVAAACQAGGARLMQISSFWAYLPLQRLPLDEDHPRSGGPFAVRMRREAEDILQDAGAAIVNLPDFYGPRVGMSVLNQALAEAAAGQTMNWIGKATVEREHLFVPDAMRLALELSLQEQAYGERWVFPTAGPISLIGIRQIVAAHLGRPIPIRAAGPLVLKLLSLFVADLRDFMPLVPSYVQPITYHGGKLEGLLGPSVLTPYETGIPATLDALIA